MGRELGLRACAQRPLPPQCCRISAFRLAVMMGWRAGLLAVSFAAVFAFVGANFGASAQQQPVAAVSAAPALPCGGDEIARGRVSRVLDGRDFVLDDDRAVHLAGIEVPLLPASETAHVAPGGAAAKTTLAALMTGAQVVLRQAELKSDRYGRIVAYADLLGGDSSRLAEAELVSAGFARVGGDVGSSACAAELLRQESAARRAKIGLWADQYYAPLRADDPPDIVAERGRFALVEGKVVSVHESGSIQKAL